ncbi:MAG TPA: DUF3137 domain-containing protein [Candidatus Paceibacterota bacterium]
MKLKDRIANETALEEAVSLQLHGIVAEVRRGVGGLEADFLKYRRRQRLGFYGLVGAFVLFYLSAELGILRQLDNATLILGIVFFFLFLILAVRFMVTGLGVVQQFHAGVDRILYEKTFSLLGLEGKWFPQPIPKNIWEQLRSYGSHTEMQRTLELLRVSEAITHPYNRTKIDDAFELNVGGRTLYGCELDLKYETGSGKNRRTIPVFSGLFISYPLQRPLEGRTFVTNNNDASGFGHSAFLGDKDERLRETELEWNEFEELLRVTTNNEVEARYILTTDFMHDLYDWWNGGPSARLSFIGSTMTLILSAKKIRFGDTIEKISDEEIKEYILTIAKPLLHVVHLVQDVRL